MSCFKEARRYVKCAGEPSVGGIFIFPLGIADCANGIADCADRIPDDADGIADDTDGIKDDTDGTNTAMVG